MVAILFSQGDREIVARSQVRQVESVGDDSHVVFSQNFSGEDV
jgi:hypothetical protein